MCAVQIATPIVVLLTALRLPTGGLGNPPIVPSLATLLIEKIAIMLLDPQKPIEIERRSLFSKVGHLGAGARGWGLEQRFQPEKESFAPLTPRSYTARFQ